jgi:hypothetical protein
MPRAPKYPNPTFERLMNTRVAREDRFRDRRPCRRECGRAGRSDGEGDESMV